MLAELWRYRGFVFGMVRREFDLRYRRSLLGSLWAVASPLGTVVIFTVIFSRIMHDRLPSDGDATTYGLFVCAGVVTWGLFADVVTRSVEIFIEHANLLKKINFPRLTLPVIVLLSTAINFGIVFGLIVAFLALSGRFPGWPILAFVPLLLVQQALALGLGVTCAVVNVFVRDVGHAVTLVLQLWFWCTPIVYPLHILSAPWQRLVKLNPLTELVIGYQQIVIHHAWPDWSPLVLPGIVAALALGGGVSVLRRLSATMVDYL